MTNTKWITDAEWKRRYCACFIELTGWEEDIVNELSEAALETLDDETPEEAAETDISYMAEDG